MKKNLLLLSILGFLVLSSNAQRVFLFEDFENASDTTPPTGWTQDVLFYQNGADELWHFNNPNNQTPDTSSTTNFDEDFAVVDKPVTATNQFSNVALVSPKFSTQGYNDVQLSFDYATIAGTAMTCYVEVSTGNGWRSIMQFGNATVIPTTFSSNISSSAKNSCEVQIRFRFTSNNSGVWMIDNVSVFANDTVPRVNDIRVIDFEPNSGVCASASKEVMLHIRNDGTANQANVPLEILIFDGTTTETLRDTISSINTCVDTLYTFKQTADLSNTNATFTITGISILANDEQRVNSDTMNVFNYTVSPAPSDPVDKVKKFCGFQTSIVDTVSLGTDEKANWFTSLLTSRTFNRGEFVTIDSIKNDTSIFVEKFIATSKVFPRSIGVQPSVRYSTANNTAGSASGIFIDIMAKEDIILSDVEIIISFAGGSFEYDIYTKGGSYVGYELDASAWTRVFSNDTTLNIGGVSVLPVGDIFIKKGDTLGFYIFNSTARSMHFSSGPITGENVDLKYYSNNVNPGSPFANGLSNFGYGSRLHYKKVCSSYRAKYEYEVTPKLFGATIDTLPGFLGAHSSSSLASNPDVIYIGETFDYELSPPTGYSYANFGTAWTITQFELKTSNNIAIPSGDTTITLPGVNRPARLSFSPSSGLQNRVIEIELTLTDLDRFCDTVITKYIRVIELPQFDLDFVNPCANSEFRIINKYQMSPTGFVFSWDFGDGNFSTDRFPRHRYTNPGTYNVRYEISTIEGLTVDTSFTVVIAENPVADFTFQNACFGEPVTFNNNSSIVTGTLSYEWDFDGQGTSSTENPSFEFDSDGLFEVKLIATSGGCSDSMINSVRQFEIPVPNFMTTGGCHNEDITFVNTSTMPSGENVGAYWDFTGDGISRTGSTVSYNFNSVGSKQVKIIAESSFKCKDSITKQVDLKEAPIADFTYDALCDKVPTNFDNLTSKPTDVSITYQWNFGDGKLSSDENPVHQYPSASNFVIRLTAIGSNNCRSSKSETVQVRLQPLASFSVQDGCSKSEVNFFNNSTSNVPGSQYLWEFDDGNTSNDFSPEHIYQNPGTYNVVLTASLEECVTKMEKELTINESPVCGFRFEQSSDNLREFTFIPDVETYSTYRWRFDNTGTSTQVSPTHVFPAPNRNYNVRLDITADNGCDCRLEDVNVFTGVNNIDAVNKNNFNIYPNPTNSFVTIELMDYDPSNALDIYVIDSKGKTIITNLNVMPNDNKIKLNMEELTSGMYLIQIKNGDSFHTERISLIK